MDPHISVVIASVVALTDVLLCVISSCMKLDGDNCKVFRLILSLDFYLLAKYVYYVGFFGCKLLFAAATEGGRNYSVSTGTEIPCKI